MTNKEILEKILKKAGKDLRFLAFDCNESEEELLIFNCIFSHEFAKAFWGEKTEEFCIEHGTENINYSCDFCCGETILICECWQYHLQQMVLEDEPLKYLEKFL